MAARPNKRRTFTVQQILVSKLGEEGFERLTSALKATTARPTRRRRRPRKAVTA